MSTKHDRYTYRITWSEDDREYAALCLEFPSLSWLAKTPENALQGIRNVVRETLADMKRSGEAPPAPLSG
ncbi:MAG: toxin-antitoxin system HicB family antitoxin, partial [Candidatus Aminicenantes bacterium]|nr:toxin-antitoxin system HicB family antitoxin [Candidatus Aminicenantes bacterium]